MARARRLQAAQGGQEPLNQELVEKVSYTAAGELSPMAAIIGGCVGQEVRASRIRVLPGGRQYARLDVFELVGQSVATGVSLDSPLCQSVCECLHP